MRARHDIYSTVFHGVYAALMANILLVVGCAPLVAGLLATDPARSWPLLALVTPLCVPAVVAVFAMMAEFSSGRGAPLAVLRTFGRSWRSAWRRGAALGALATGALVVLGVDMAWASGRRLGAVVIPVLGMLLLLVVSTTLLALVVLAERPAVRLRDALRASLYLAVRRWYLTALSWVVLALLLQLVAARPALGLGLAPAPLLYVVWANSRFSLRPALDPSGTDAGATTTRPTERSTWDGSGRGSGHPGRGRRAAAARA